MIEKAREFCSPLYMCFMDLKKAYDSVDRTGLWEVLQCTYGLPRKLITLHPNSDPVEVVSTFEYLDSTMSDDCSLTAEVEARTSKASKAFSSLSRVLWYQRKGK